jgi:hypothetical protein
MRLGLSLLFCMVLGVFGGAVHAQDEVDPARAASARALFEEGVSLSDQGKWTDATDRFRRALALRDSQVIRYNLAAALLELGQVVEATELLRQVERDETADAKLRGEASTRLNDALAKMAKLTVHVEGPLEGASFELDEHALETVQLEVAIPADPGMHRLKATRAGEEVASSEVTLAAGEAKTVTLRLTPPVVATPAEAAQTVALTVPEPGKDQGEAPKRKKIMWWAIGGGAAVAVVAVVATVLATHRTSDKSEAPYHGNFDPPSLSVQVGQ